MPLTYDPNVFSVRDLEQARRIILTAESSTTDHRWKDETPFMCDLLSAHNDIGPNTLILDYGCGVGRMAKELISRFNCRVLGIDISASMRALSVEYVNSDNFSCCTPSMLALLLDRGLRFDLAISIWVLQHCLTPGNDIGYLKQSLKNDGGLFVVNNVHRAVPTKEGGWADDNIDIKASLSKAFHLTATEILEAPAVPSTLSGITFWAAFKKA